MAYVDKLKIDNNSYDIKDTEGRAETAKTIPVDRDQPYHSQTVEQKTHGDKKEGLPQAPWVHPANRNRNNRKRQGHKSFIGRRQPDFGQKG